MNRTFLPGFTIIQPEYGQGSSGGMVIIIPDDLGTIYQDDNGRLYQYLEANDEDATNGAGWYWFEDGVFEFNWYGTSIPADWKPLP